MSGLKGKTDLAKLKNLSKKPYAFQAKWFLNAFWKSGPKVGKDEKVLESVWTFAQNMIKLDKDGKKGCELEEFDAHRFLEKNTEALTWTDMRNALKELDIDFDKKVSLTEFLVHHFKVDWKKLVNAAQGSNELVAKAEKACAEAQEKRDVCVKKLEQAAADEEAAQKAATKAAEDEKEAQKTAAEAKALAEEARQASDEAKAAHDVQLEAEAEVKAILARIKGYQDALKKRADALQAIIDDDSVGQVKKMKAKHELNDLKNGSRARRKGISECNPELLRKAKIDQKAAVRKQKRATAEAKAKADIATDAAEKADESHDAAERARKHAEATARDAAEKAEQASKTKAAAEAAVKEAEKAMEAAQVAFKKAKENAKGGEGTIWWMGRYLEEQKKYLPRAAFNRLKKKHAKKVEAVRKGESA